MNKSNLIEFDCYMAGVEDKPSSSFGRMVRKPAIPVFEAQGPNRPPWVVAETLRLHLVPRMRMSRCRNSTSS